MKKYILPIISAALFFTSCDLDINENPNYPSSGSITTDLVFPSVQNALAAASCDDMFHYAGFFAQYFEQMPETNQFNNIADYSFRESDDVMSHSYYDIFAQALPDIEDIKAKTTNTADLFAATVMRAFAFQLMVDNTSDSPYTEALQGSANPSPVWDDGETVYKGVLAEMDAAEAALDEAGDQMTMTDMMFNKNISKWKGYANALRLRMYMRMYDKDNSVREKIVSLVNANKFFTGDVVMDIYADNAGNRSPFYSSYYTLGTGNHCAAYPIISYMSAMGDPRIAYAFSPATASGKYVGQIPGAKADEKDWGLGATSGKWLNSDVSNVNYALYDGSGASRPAFLFTQANLQFLIAEVNMRFLNNEAAAKAAYEAAIVADFAARGMSSDAGLFLAGEAAWDKASDKLHLIYMQKWVALFYMDNMEAWSEIRRTNVPELSAQNGEDIAKNPSIYTPGELIEPYRNGLGSGLIKRMYYPKRARDLNKNTPAAQSASTPVWWDVN